MRAAALVLVLLAASAAEAQPGMEVIRSDGPPPPGATLDPALFGKWRIEGTPALGEDEARVLLHELAILFRADGLTTTLASASVADLPRITRLTVFTAWSDSGRVFSPDDTDGEPYSFDADGALLIAVPGLGPPLRLLRVPERPPEEPAVEDGP